MKKYSVPFAFVALILGMILAPLVVIPSGAQVSSPYARRVLNVTSDPANCANGEIRNRTDTNALRLCNDGSWAAVGATVSPAGSSGAYQINNGGAFGGGLLSQSGGNVTLASGQLLLPNGIPGTPGLGFTNATNTGLGLNENNQLEIHASGVVYVRVVGNMFELGANKMLAWSDTNDPSGATANDTMITRAAANTHAFGNGGVGDDSGTVKLSTLRLKPVAFASLPASPAEGMMAWVNNSNTATWGATVAGGGSDKVLVVYNGTNWTVAGK